MSNLSPQETAKILAGGLLSFPVTHFDAQLRFQEGPYREHCDWLLSFGRLTGLFCAGGTGEVFSLTPDEVFQVTKAAVAATKGRTPVIAGAGYGTAIAVEMAKNAEKAGADGLPDGAHEHIGRGHGSALSPADAGSPRGDRPRRPPRP